MRGSLLHVANENSVASPGSQLPVCVRSIGESALEHKWPVQIEKGKHLTFNASRIAFPVFAHNR